MKFRPDYAVGYRGATLYPGQAYEIDSKDADELKQHGTLIEEKKAEAKAPVVSTPDEDDDLGLGEVQEEKPVKKTRSRK